MTGDDDGRLEQAVWLGIISEWQAALMRGLPLVLAPILAALLQLPSGQPPGARGGPTGGHRGGNRRGAPSVVGIDPHP